MSTGDRRRARKARRPSAGRGRSRRIKQEKILRRRAVLAALVFVLAAALLTAVYRIVRDRYSDKVDYPESSHAWWDFAWNGGETDGDPSGDRPPQGEAMIVEGPEADATGAGFTWNAAETEGRTAVSDDVVISYAEPTGDLFKRLLGSFEVPEDRTETPDYGYSLDADDYMETGGTAQGLLEVSEDVPDGCIGLDRVPLPEAVADTPELYTYDEMLEDFADLQKEYGGLWLASDGDVTGERGTGRADAEVDISGGFEEKGCSLMRMISAGDTYDGREIRVIYVGSRQAPHNIMITGSIHAREYITSDLVMKQLGTLLEAAASGASFDGRAVADWLNEVCVVFVPMCNPDGVSISQFGVDGLKDHILRANVEAAYENDRAAGKSDASQGFQYFTKRWKSNARGVNLNENFNALWERIPSDGRMSGGGYKGDSPCSEIETKVLTILADERHYEAAVHYHAMGQVLYWDICNNRLREHARDLANQIMTLTGYTMQISDDGGGYKDYFHLKDDPAASLTVEVGETEAPVAIKEMPEIWQQNRLVPYMTMKWAAEKGQ